MRDGGAHVGNLKRYRYLHWRTGRGWRRQYHPSRYDRETAPVIWLLLSFALAKESWLCTTDASQVRGQSIMACGIGHGADEDIARARAFDSAKSEFNRICNASSSCIGKAASLEPRRTTCEVTRGIWKCHRLLVFTISDEPAPMVAAPLRAKFDETKEYTASDFWDKWNYDFMARQNR